MGCVVLGKWRWSCRSEVSRSVVGGKLLFN